jgi:hypothetical protein
VPSKLPPSRPPTALLRRLAEQIQAVQGRFDGGDEQRAPRRLPTGWWAVDRALAGGPGAVGGLLCGAVHEWFGPESGPDRAWVPPLSLLAHLARQALAADPCKHLVWIGRCVRPHPPWLARLGRRTKEGRLLLQRSIFIDLPQREPGLRLWAIDLALRSAATAALVADGSLFDMAATRRLQLAAEAAQCPALLARPLSELAQLSAAATRWRVGHEPADDVHPQWKIELVRHKTTGTTNPHWEDGASCWIVQQDDEKDTVRLHAELGGGSGQTASSHGAGPRRAAAWTA